MYNYPMRYLWLWFLVLLFVAGLFGFLYYRASYLKMASVPDETPSSTIAQIATSTFMPAGFQGPRAEVQIQPPPGPPPNQ